MTVLLFEEDIIGLDISMDNSPGASVVHYVEGFGNVDKAVPDEILGKLAESSNSMMQISSSAEFKPSNQTVIVVADWFKRETRCLDDPSAAGENIQ